jgi:hypothetical protein
MLLARKALPFYHCSEILLLPFHILAGRGIVAKPTQLLLHGPLVINVGLDHCTYYVLCGMRVTNVLGADSGLALR